MGIDRTVNGSTTLNDLRLLSFMTSGSSRFKFSSTLADRARDEYIENSELLI